MIGRYPEDGSTVYSLELRLQITGALVYLGIQENFMMSIYTHSAISCILHRK